ncbi:sulfatase [Flammeovirga sp. EKP202]|uniref:sulfatase family protein n=1 Tax=Flammeovirga sp. EKP202 TaxID=2770592 RepID=UPI00166006BD|nr:sulfatase [Flammeovirga sp. EKP202]MBD0401914.1 sulfatase [Flammeovirga sp. EKP202]
MSTTKRYNIFFKSNFIHYLILTVLTFSCSRINKPLENRPNILFCVADDAGMFMSAYGSKFVNTPAFDKVAQNGLLFMNAYTPTPKSGPSRSIILTGRNTWQLEEGGGQSIFFPEKFTTYVETLNKHGYNVGFTGRGWESDENELRNESSRLLTGRSYNKYKMIPPTKMISSDNYAKNFEYFLSQQEDGKPWAFWYGSKEPQRGYTFRSGVEIGGKKLSDIPSEEIYKFWPDNDTVRHDLLDYALEVEYSDYHLGLMLESLEKNNQLDNTIVIVTSDNGMPFPRVQGMGYERSTHLPLAVMWGKGITNPGRVINDYVSFADFAPTFLEVAGIDPSKTDMKKMTGKSLTDLLYSTKEGFVNEKRNFVLLGKERNNFHKVIPNDHPVRGIIMDGYLYLHNYSESFDESNINAVDLSGDMSPTQSWILKAKNENDKYWKMTFGKNTRYELYDIKNDPDCINNLISLPLYKNRVAEMSSFMNEKLIEQNDPRMFGNEEVFERLPFSSLYIQNPFFLDSNVIEMSIF